jgi:hypothetical protein
MLRHSVPQVVGTLGEWGTDLLFREDGFAGLLPCTSVGDRRQLAALDTVEEADIGSIVECRQVFANKLCQRRWARHASLLVIGAVVSAAFAVLGVLRRRSTHCQRQV